jgi:HSP20 family molecular chaperone IbpA
VITGGIDMSEAKDVTSQTARTAPESRDAGQAIRPAVDIFEDRTGITVQADMPGVSRERLNVHIDSDTLSIEGDVDIPVPDGMEAVSADIHATRYRRSFSLSGELDAEKIDATLRDGVLILRIPKREEHKPRKIEVRTG